MSSSEDTDDEKFSTGDRSATRADRIDKILHPFVSLKNSNSDLSPKELKEIREFLEDGLRHRSQTCLICIETLKRTEAVWTCDSCFTLFHLVCIQSWARHGLSEYALQAGEEESEKTVLEKARWYCPKCRREYKKNQCPKEYRCFCQQEVNPKPDPWLLPHSCGQTCHRRLIGCEHTCLLLCHPGPCPLCPKTVMASCHCGKKPPVMRRCGQKLWSCGAECGRKLSCGVHRCRNICHAGQCDPCNEITQRPCVCGGHSEKRPCSDGRWRCDTVCGRQLNCKRHYCRRICHDGQCPPCGDGDVGNRCPCGKTVYETSNSVDCIDDLRPCGDTCGKLLDCGVHYCVDRCHKGQCSPCTQLREKQCRCGLKVKLTPCSKEFLCDLKCKRKRQCGRHPCNRRCCDGECPPCELACGRTLQCGKHKCQTPCHRGLCYPCVLTTEVKCRCGQTKIKVPCGAEKRTKPPRCRQQCSIPPDCHHEKRDRHHCHFDDCPPCRQICMKQLEKCGHSCGAICHSAVMMDVNAAAAKKPAASPLEKHQPKFERVQLPCPPCQYPVSVTCIGKHETSNFPCSEARPYSCGRKCGRPLACGNHNCAKLCHSVEESCQECTESCSLPRPKDCTHPCIKACHPAPCAPCRQMIRRTCHCGLNQKYIPCVEWNRSDDNGRRSMLSCGNACPKLLSCGHQCTLQCHESECSSPDICERKVTIRCPCNRRSLKSVCSKVRQGTVERLHCDDECKAIQATKKQIQKNEEPATPSPTEETKDATPFGPRRRRKQKPRSTEGNDHGTFVEYVKEKKAIVITSLAVFILAIFTWWLMA